MPYSRKRLAFLYTYILCTSLSLMCSPALSRAEPPAGRPKFNLIFANVSFFENFDHFSVACPNTSLSTDFSKTMQSTQRCHSWIARDLIYIGKLLRSQTNSQILRNLRFCDPFTPIFDKHIEIKLPLRLYYSRA